MAAEPVAKKARLAAPEGLCDQAPAIVRFRPEGKTEKPKVLEYFCLQALGECARLMLEVTETPYDSVMHFNGADMKKYAPFGQLPLYRGEELEGLVLSQSGAICRHLARHLGLAGKGEREQALADSIFELHKDMMGKKAGLHDPESGDAGKLRDFLLAAEQHAPASDSGFWVGAGLSVADVAMFHALRTFLDIKPGCLESYPKLIAFVEHFGARPAVKSYLDSERRVPLTHNEIGDKPWAPDGYRYLTPLKPGTHSELYMAN